MIYSFLGWAMESTYVSINAKKWVNRGFINGPFCPIYGTGALLILLALEPVSDSILLLFLGGCTATCTAGNLTDFNFRKLHTLVRRGEYQGVYEQMNKCMLCGKCRLVCPRGINTRAVVMLIKRKLGDF